MTKTLLLAVATLALSVPEFAQPPQEKPGPEHQALGHFVGNWKIEGKVAPGPMGPGGPFSGTETCRTIDGGFHIVCDTKGTGALGDMKGHMSMTWDRHAKTYRFFGVNNTPDAEFGTGTYKGNTWTFNSEMIMNGKKFRSRFTLVETSPTVHTVKFEVSEDGKQWVTFMEGKSTKQ